MITLIIRDDRSRTDTQWMHYFRTLFEDCEACGGNIFFAEMNGALRQRAMCFVVGENKRFPADFKKQIEKRSSEFALPVLYIVDGRPENLATY